MHLFNVYIESPYNTDSDQGRILKGNLESVLWYALLQSSFQINIMFNNKTWALVIEIRICYSKFMISIALLK